MMIIISLISILLLAILFIYPDPVAKLFYAIFPKKAEASKKGYESTPWNVYDHAGDERAK